MTNNPIFNYPEQTAVPETLRLQLRKLWLKGAKPDELAAAYKLPFDWVMDFVTEGRRPRSIT